MDQLPAKADLKEKPLPAPRMRIKRRASQADAVPGLRERQYRVLGVDLAVHQYNDGGYLYYPRSGPI